MKDFPINGKNYCMKNPMTDKIIYLFYDTVHLVKNIQNNLLGRCFFTVPKFELSILDVLFSIPEGHVRWCSLHKVHDFDLSLNCHLRKAPALNYSVLHPGNNKQSVPLALAIFDSKTTTAMRQYLQESDYVTPAFLALTENWSQENWSPENWSRKIGRRKIGRMENWSRENSSHGKFVPGKLVNPKFTT